jgi:hypothetical protein
MAVMTARWEVISRPSAPRQGDDAVAGPVDAAARAGQFRSRQPACSLHPGPGSLVEGGHVRPPPGIQPGLVAGGHVGGPGVHGLLQGVVAFGHGMNAALGVVPGDRLGDVAGAQLRQRATLRHVVLVAVFAELVDTVWVPADQGRQRPRLGRLPPAGGGRRPGQVWRRRPRRGR